MFWISFISLLHIGWLSDWFIGLKYTYLHNSDDDVFDKYIPPGNSKSSGVTDNINEGSVHNIRERERLIHVVSYSCACSV